VDAEVIEQIEEHRELFERLAASDLPIRQDARRALELLEAAQ
jgi:hypothetical protein